MRHGCASSGKDAQLAWIGTLDETGTEQDLTVHPLYFSLQDVLHAAITTKIQHRDHNAHNIAAHANPGATHKHDDRLVVKKASAREESSNAGIFILMIALLINLNAPQ